MNQTESTRDLPGSKTLSFKNASLIFATWVLAGGLLTFARITHPAFGVQGDLPLHYHALRSFERSVSEGVLAPRWAGLMEGGRGGARFTFYPPLSCWLSVTTMKAFGVDALGSLKIGSLLILIIAQFSAYIFARQFFSRRASLIASLTWVLLPAYPMIALHRAFFANALALSLVPLALLGAHLLLSEKNRTRGFAVFTLSCAAIVLTHPITTYLTAIAVGLMILVYLPIRGWRAITRLAGAGVVTLALTAFFLWPQWIEASWTQMSLQIVQQDYHNYFLFAKAPDGSRYRMGWADFNYVASVITITQTLMALLFGLMCLKFLSAKKSSTPLTAVARLGVVMAVFGLIISLPISELLWRYAPGFKFIQFPWRFQPFVALGIGLLAATAVETWPALNHKLRVIIPAFLTWIVIVCVILTLMIARLDKPNITRAETIDLLSAPGAKPITTEERQKLLDEEDMRQTWYTANEFYYRPHGTDAYLYPPATEPGGLSIISGRGRVVSQRLNIGRREFLIEGEEPSRARLETYHYPHWVARLDGREIEIIAERGSGLMLVDLPLGRHLLTLDYEVRQVSQRIARAISSVTWGAFLAWMVMRATKRMWSKRTLTQ
ncbi:MAG: 6-pyruvoyl-tetrahydropterin synthase-related protein [Acidobacteria bacterium]|nr:6-pyruvoyl-tetrahydropterin synthase-related protein [Acidobacteriota bacterium]